VPRRRGRIDLAGAHAALEEGHTRGKIVLRVSDD